MEMKKVQQLFLIVVSVLGITGCATPAYLADRRRDALDILTVTVGAGIGAKARAGPVQAGLLLQSDRMGLRGGALFCLPRYADGWWPPAFDAQLLVAGVELFGPEILKTRERNKEFEAVSSLTVCATDKGDAPYYYTQVETVLAVGPSARLGLNPGELLDFVLGWLMVDIFKDDLETGKSNSAPEDTARKLADPQR